MLTQAEAPKAPNTKSDFCHTKDVRYCPAKLLRYSDHCQTGLQINQFNSIQLPAQSMIWAVSLCTVRKMLCAFVHGIKYALCGQLN